MLRILLLLFAFSLPLTACEPVETDDPDATGELPDPDPSDPPGDVDPLSRDDGITSDDDALDQENPETGQELFQSPVETQDPPIDEEPDSDM